MSRFTPFSVSADRGIRRGRLLLHPHPFRVREGVSVRPELQQGRGIPGGGHALQRQAGLLARHPHRQEPPGSGEGHHSQQEQVLPLTRDYIQSGMTLFKYTCVCVICIKNTLVSSTGRSSYPASSTLFPKPPAETAPISGGSADFAAPRGT